MWGILRACGAPVIEAGTHSVVQQGLRGGHDVGGVSQNSVLPPPPPF